MPLSKDDLQDLRNYKYFADDDNTRIKEIIKNKLINDSRIIHVLDNKTLNEESPDDYLWKNIFPVYVIPGTITDAENYICFDTKTSHANDGKKVIKVHQIIFYVLCDVKNVLDRETGLARPDLICAIIKDIFNWTQIFGPQVNVTDETPSVVDNDYVARTLTFEMTTTNSIVQTKDGNGRVINYGVHQ